jgi:hypothetical protein
MERKRMKTSEVVRRAEKLLDREARERSERTLRKLAERIAYHERAAREERELRGQ